MNIMTLKILSSGLVCPGGIGVESLQKPWTCAPVQNASGTRGILSAQTILPEAVAQKWQLKPRLRRASPISHLLIEAVSQALQGQSDENLKQTGVVACFFLGCLNHSVRFYKEITKDGRRFASPVLFPETVFNSPISHVVSTLGIGGPVYSQIGDKSAWVSAFRTAECWMRTGSAKQVVVVGAEEFDPHALSAFESAGWTRSSDFIPGSGAGAVLLGSSDSEGVVVRKVTEGHGFFTKAEAAVAAAECFGEMDQNCPVMQTATGWAVRMERKILGDRSRVPNPNPGVECFAASAAWDTIRAAHLIQTGAHQGADLVVPVWGLTQQFAAIQLGGGVGPLPSAAA
jgi:hypothetical protein